MCHALYLASDKPLPEVKFDPEIPGFHTLVPYEGDENILKQFSLPFIIYLGNDEGCGCGWSYTPLREKTVHDLFDYLEQALQRKANLEMAYGDHGEEKGLPYQKKELSSKDFLNSEFPLDVGEFATIYNR